MAHRCKCLKKDSWNVTELKKDNIVRNINIHTGGHQRTYWHMHTCACCSTPAYSCAHARTHARTHKRWITSKMSSSFHLPPPFVYTYSKGEAIRLVHPVTDSASGECSSATVKNKQHSKLFPLSFVKIVGWVQIDGLVTFCPAVTQLLTGLKASTN